MSSSPGNAPRAAGDAFDPALGGPQILMCPPDFYGIEYEINPWMSRQKQADPGAGQNPVAGPAP